MYIHSDRISPTSDVRSAVSMTFVSVWCTMLHLIQNANLTEELLRLEDGITAFIRSFDT
jgi:hypothetical protein